MTPHKDINGKEIQVGSRAVFVGTDTDKSVVGRHVWVRATTPGRDRSIRVDDGNEHDTDLQESESWQWSGWVDPDELSVID